MLGISPAQSSRSPGLASTRGVASRNPGWIRSQDNRDGDDVACIAPPPRRRPARHRHALATPLVRPVPVEVGDVLAERPAQVALAERKQVVEAFLPNTPVKPLDDR